MTDRFDRKYRPFVTLPRHRRREEVIRLKGRIRRDAAVFGGRYTSHHVPPNPDQPDLCCQWDDFEFPGSDRFTWWNAEMITARQAFWYDAQEAARKTGLTEEQIIREAPPAIHESFRVDRRYSMGIGLHIVLDVDRIDRASIEATIDRFFAVGETDWRSPLPVPRDRLPILSEIETMRTLGVPGVALLRAVR